MDWRGRISRRRSCSASFGPLGRTDGVAAAAYRLADAFLALDVLPSSLSRLPWTQVLDLSFLLLQTLHRGSNAA